MQRMTSFKLTKYAFVSLFLVTFSLGFSDTSAQEESHIETSTSYSGQIVSRIAVRGNYRIDQESVLSVINTKEGERLNSTTAEQDIKSIYRLGFFDFVEVDLANSTSGLVVTYVLKERPAIKDIRFSGNDEFSSDTLKEKLNLEPKKMNIDINIIINNS
jgi:outer membrane protein insertion porin family